MQLRIFQKYHAFVLSTHDLHPPLEVGKVFLEYTKFQEMQKTFWSLKAFLNQFFYQYLDNFGNIVKLKIMYCTNFINFSVFFND